MRYFINDHGGWMSVSGDADMLGAVVPDGYRQVDEAEFNQAAGTIIVELPQGQPAVQHR
jgi:hypothetical protein